MAADDSPFIPSGGTVNERDGAKVASVSTSPPVLHEHLFVSWKAISVCYF
jgi:hypothetical protein